MAQSFPGRPNIPADVADSFTDHGILAFAREFCSGNGSITGSFCTNVLYESLVQEKPEILRTYLHMFNMIGSLALQAFSSIVLGRLGHLDQPWEVANMLLINSYYQSSFATRLAKVAAPLLQVSSNPGFTDGFFRGSSSR